MQSRAYLKFSSTIILMSREKVEYIIVPIKENHKEISKYFVIDIAE